jgi:hypothetical protein
MILVLLALTLNAAVWGAAVVWGAVSALGENVA